MKFLCSVAQRLEVKNSSTFSLYENFLVSPPRPSTNTPPEPASPFAPFWVLLAVALRRPGAFAFTQNFCPWMIWLQKPLLPSIMSSLIGKGKSSLRQAAFRSLKSTHTRTCPFFLRTGTMLEMKSTWDISLWKRQLWICPPLRGWIPIQFASRIQCIHIG